MSGVPKPDPWRSRSQDIAAMRKDIAELERLADWELERISEDGVAFVFSAFADLCSRLDEVAEHLEAIDGFLGLIREQAERN
jgi:hypothetical protein